MTGKVVAVSIGWTVDTPDGPRRTLISLAERRRHCRSERVEDLLDDLMMLCSDVQNARDGVTVA
jgi:hypothetical protein